MQYKIVFTGPVGAGKTTAISAISDTPPVSTEQKATDETRQKKEFTTVAMDYGSIRLADGSQVHLYGTPGQERFDFMWDILSRGAIGLIVMVDHQGRDPLGDLSAFLGAFSGKFDAHQMVVGVNKFSHGGRLSLDDYHGLMLERGLVVPVLEIDARSKSDVVTLVEALIYNIDPRLQSI